MEVNKSLKEYIEMYIIPKYNKFDAAHGIDHVNYVINRSLKLAEIYNLDVDMCYTIAAYHDLGLEHGREMHHKLSGYKLKNDFNLCNWFTTKQMLTMGKACEEHRASMIGDVSSIYSAVVADADRDDNIDTMILRSYGYHITHDEDKSVESLCNDVYNHLKAKYGKNGYAKLRLEKSYDISEGSREAVEILEDENKFYNKMNAILKNILLKE